MKKLILVILTLLTQNNSFTMHKALAPAVALQTQTNSIRKRHFSDSKYDEIMRKCNTTRVTIFKMSKIEEKRLDNVNESVAKAKAAFDHKEYKRAMQICANGNTFDCGIDDIHLHGDRLYSCWCNTEIQEALNELSTSLASLQRCKKSLSALRAKDSDNEAIRSEFIEAEYKKKNQK